MFKKILRNEIDDCFFDVFCQTRDSLKRKIHQEKSTHITKFSVPGKEREIEVIPLSLALDLAKEIIPEFDRLQIEIANKLQAKGLQRQKMKGEYIQNERLIKVTDLTQIILSQRVQFHVRFLERVRRNFKSLEFNNSGFLQIELLEKFSKAFHSTFLKNWKQLFASFMNVECRFVSFSDIVKTLSENFVIEDSQYETILEKIFNFDKLK